MEPAATLRDVQLMQGRLDSKVAAESFRTWLLGIFAAVALLLAVAGVFGVTACGVSRRTAEIGIRMALGARQLDVVREVTLETTKLAGICLCIGLSAAWFGVGFIQKLLFEVSMHDPLLFAAGSTALIVAVVVAAFLPALRAAATDPASAVRAE